MSVLWALADQPTRDAVLAAHHAAINDVIGLMEREVAATRAGATGPDGPVAQVAVSGLVGTAFDHWDSRTGDPQLHTHVVIANKAKAVFDGRWRALDGRPIHAAMVALSEHYNAILADRLTNELGVTWTPRDRGANRNVGWEIAGIPDRLLDLFSSRTTAIDAETDQLIAKYRTEHGHAPSAETIIRLRGQATLATRPDKTLRSLADLQTDWQTQATNHLDRPAGQTVAAAIGRAPATRSDGLSEEMISQLADRVVDVVGERRSTWRYWNLHAQASRQTIGLRFPTPQARETVVGQIVAAAEDRSVRLTPPELAPTPPAFQRPDGTSRFRPAHTAVYTSVELLAAEDRLLQHSRRIDGPEVPVRNLRTAAHLTEAQTGLHLGHDQVEALIKVGTSRRSLDVLVGPAGAGKTTAMRTLRQAWDLSHGPGSVIGLAPSAAAAQMLAEDLAIATENTAKWLHDHTTNRTELRAGQLVIIHEASLAATTTLDRIASHASEVGAKVLLVGDHAQLGAVGAGGAFGLLVRDEEDPAELTGIHRFTNPWEKTASLALRDGDHTAITTYTKHNRIQSGPTDQMLHTLLDAWTTDTANGLTSVMVADTLATVAELNRLAQTSRTGEDGTSGVRLHTGNNAGPGDVILTRRNNRGLHTGQGWVKNGDRWTVTHLHPDGAITAMRLGGRGTVRLPAAYVAEHVELGYALTVHRAQGLTVDRAHVLARPGMTREAFYVAMTRGRYSNTAYVATDQPDTERHHQPRPLTTVETILAGSWTTPAPSNPPTRPSAANRPAGPPQNNSAPSTPPS